MFEKKVHLQRMPASAGFGGNQTNAYWTENGYGTTQVNLRGLGIKRTLVLLNGRRVVNGGTGANSAVDLNVIPIAMIQRIEVLKDGASAIYRADAVAGVVNIITKMNFDGLEAAVRYGQTFEDDGEEKSPDPIWGRTGDLGSLMAGISYSGTGEVNMADRAPCGVAEDEGQLVCFGSSATIGGRAVLADGTRVNFNQDPNGDGDFYEPYSPALPNFHFLRPMWFWALIPGLGLWILMLIEQSNIHRWRTVIAPHLLKNLVRHPKQRPWIRPTAIALPSLVMSILALAGPAWERQKTPFVQDEAPLVVALDLSQSMNAVDVQPTRLQRSQQKIRDLLVLRPRGADRIDRLCPKFAYVFTSHR